MYPPNSVVASLASFTSMNRLLKKYGTGLVAAAVVLSCVGAGIAEAASNTEVAVTSSN
jgi:hypothetical protein